MASSFQKRGEISPSKNCDYPSHECRIYVANVLIARALRSVARSPYLAPPHIRFLFVIPRSSLPASFSAPSRANTLLFAPVPAIKFREDFHLQITAHAGLATCKTAPRQRAAGLCY